MYHDYKNILWNCWIKAIVLPLHACRQLPGPTRLDDQVYTWHTADRVIDIKWHVIATYMDLIQERNLRNNHTEFYKDMRQLFNIRVTNKSGPSSSKHSSNKAIYEGVALLTSGQSWWDSSVTIIYNIIYMHPNHWIFALFSQVVDRHQNA